MLDTGRIASTTGRKMSPSTRTRPSSRPTSVAPTRRRSASRSANTRRLAARSRTRSRARVRDELRAHGQRRRQAVDRRRRRRRAGCDSSDHTTSATRTPARRAATPQRRPRGAAHARLRRGIDAARVTRFASTSCANDVLLNFFAYVGRSTPCGAKPSSCATRHGRDDAVDVGHVARRDADQVLLERIAHRRLVDLGEFGHLLVRLAGIAT